MNTAILTSAESETSPVLVPLTVQQYHAMMETGILVEGDPIELIDGLLVRKDRRDSEGDIKTVGPRHAMTLTLLARAIEQTLSALDCHTRQQQPVTLTGVDEPEPDISVVRGGPSRYEDHHPGPTDISIVIEIADSSLEYDRNAKLQLYAATGIPQYWIVNLQEKMVEIFERPLTSDERYLNQSTCKLTQRLSFILDNQTFEIDLKQLFSSTNR